MMIWADVFETNLEKLRRYAALAAGDDVVGDKILETAIEGLISGDVPAERPSVAGAFAIVDEIVRDRSGVSGRARECDGRWQNLTCLERRLILLVEMEGLSLQDAARITGQPIAKITAKFSSARLKYADSLP